MSFYLRKYMWLISLVAVALCSYFLARLTSHMISARFVEGTKIAAVSSMLVKPDTPQKVLNEETLKQILERNMFDSKAVPPGEIKEGGTEEQEEVIPTGVAVATSLKVKLVSTFSVGEGLDSRSFCVVTAGGRDAEHVYTINDKNQFAPDVKIVKILNTRIEFINKGRLEFLELEGFNNNVDISTGSNIEGVVKETRTSSRDEPKIEKKSEGSFIIDRSEIEAAVGNLDKLMTQARVNPFYKNGKPSGLKITSLRADSIFAKLGLKRGDILQKINGTELGIANGLQMFNQLKDEKNLVIEIERQGKAVTQEYEIR